MRARREQTTDCSAAMFRGLEPVGRRETPRQYGAAWRQTEDTLPAGGGGREGGYTQTKNLVPSFIVRWMFKALW